MSLIGQEVAQDRWIPIPDPVRAVYAMWRPTPLHRAFGLEQALGTDCRIFYKYEGGSPAGSHKPNTAVPQAYYNREEGVRAPGHGDGRRASGARRCPSPARCSTSRSRSTWCARRTTPKPYRRSLIETWGAEVVPSPSPDTNAGRARSWPQNPDSTGSLGIAISEAVEDAATREDTKYALGSVLNHVLLHQTVIGQEAKKQLELAGAYPDIVVGCTGGGSNFAGLAFPFLADKVAGRELQGRRRRARGLPDR